MFPYSPGDKPPIYFYGKYFKFSPLHQETGVNTFKPTPDINMFLLYCHMRSNCQCMGDIVQLTDVQEIVKLVPWFGPRMDDSLNSDNSLDIPDSFHLNYFANKETFTVVQWGQVCFRITAAELGCWGLIS